jgi:hypothetical protein
LRRCTRPRPYAAGQLAFTYRASSRVSGNCRRQLSRRRDLQACRDHRVNDRRQGGAGRVACRRADPVDRVSELDGAGNVDGVGQGRDLGRSAGLRRTVVVAFTRWRGRLIKTPSGGADPLGYLRADAACRGWDLRRGVAHARAGVADLGGTASAAGGPAGGGRADYGIRPGPGQAGLRAPARRARGAAAALVVGGSPARRRAVPVVGEGVGARPVRAVQALFDHGRLVAAHTAVQIAVGAGGSAAARLSVNHSTAVKHAGAAMSRPP